MSYPISEHAVERYRKRARKPDATSADVYREVAAATFSATPPACLTVAQDSVDAAGYLVAQECVFVLRVAEDGSHVVVTALPKRKRRSKAERRAWREQLREEVV